MSDILENVGESMDNPEETDKIYQNVLQEVGISLEKEMPDAKINNPNEEKKEDDLDKMLGELKEKKN